MNDLIIDQGQLTTPSPFFISGQNSEAFQTQRPMNGSALCALLDAFQGYETQIREYEEAFTAEISALQKEYVLLSASDVRELLYYHRSLPGILLEASTYLRKQFGHDAIFQLRITGQNGESRSIAAVVIWTGVWQDAEQALDRFDSDWWLQNVQRAAGNIIFDYELR